MNARVLFVYDYEQSGSERVLTAFAKELRLRNYTVDCMAILDKPLAFKKKMAQSVSNDYDVVHFWNIRSSDSFLDDLCLPFGTTIHQIILPHNTNYIDHLKAYPPNWVHVMDSFTQQLLGTFDIASTRTRQCSDIEDRRGFLPLPPKLLLGSLGGNIDGSKRFDKIATIAEVSGIPVRLHDSSKYWAPIEVVDDFFATISIYINGALGVCGPIPPQEALLSGRPVLSVYTETMEQVIEHGKNGRFFDGSIKDGVRQLKIMLDDLDSYHKNTKATSFNNIEPAVDIFERKLLEILDES